MKQNDTETVRFVLGCLCNSFDWKVDREVCHPMLDKSREKEWRRRAREREESKVDSSTNSHVSEEKVICEMTSGTMCIMNEQAAYS